MILAEKPKTVGPARSAIRKSETAFLSTNVSAWRNMRGSFDCSSELNQNNKVKMPSVAKEMNVDFFLYFKILLGWFCIPFVSFFFCHSFWALAFLLASSSLFFIFVFFIFFWVLFIFLFYYRNKFIWKIQALKVLNWL